MSTLKEQIDRFGQNEERVDKFVNGAINEFVTTRFGTQYPTLPNAVTQVIDAGGFTPFASTEGLLASTPVEAVKAGIAMDTGKVYLWSNGAWTDSKISFTDKFYQLWNEIAGLKGALNTLLAGVNTTKFLNRGRYYRDGTTDLSVHGYDQHTPNYQNTGFIFVPKGATVKTAVVQENLGNNGDVGHFLLWDKKLRFVEDKTQGNITNVSESVDYVYTATEDCYVTFSTVNHYGSGLDFTVTVEGGFTNLFPYIAEKFAGKYEFTNYDKSLLRLLANHRFSLSYQTSMDGKLAYSLSEVGRVTNEGQFDLLGGGGDIYTNAYRNSGFIRLNAGDVIDAVVLNPDSNIAPVVVFDLDLKFKSFMKDTTIPGDSYRATYSYTATEDCYVVITTINPANRAYVADPIAIVTPLGYDTNTSWNKAEINKFLRIDNSIELISERIEQVIPFLAPGTGYTTTGQMFDQTVSPEYWSAYKSTGLIRVHKGDTFEFCCDVQEPGGIMSLLNFYDYNKNFQVCIHSISEFGSQGLASKHMEYTADADGYISITSIHRAGDPLWEGLSNPWVIKNRKNQLTKLVNPVNNNVVKNTMFTLPKPSSIIILDIFAEAVFPPETKAQGTIKADIRLNVDGVVVESVAEYAVQGSSSAAYPKKNFSFGFFTDKTLSTERTIKLGDLIPQQELVWKANYIDATHSRNILCNRLWEDMVQSRKGFPKREVDVMYVNQLGTKSLDTGATGHVDGYPCVVNLNGKFYGIGTLNIGKKRDNYNLNKDNKNQIQFELLGGGVNFTAETPPYANLGLRNPKLSGYKEGATITDATVVASMQALWNYHRLSEAERIAQFDKFYDRTNVVDWYMLVEFTAAADLLDKNSILTTWDGKKYYWMPYDLDTTFGIHWAGTGLGYDSNWNWDANNIIPIVKPCIINDVIKRYAQLRKNGIFSLSQVYKINRDIESKFTLDLFKQEQAKWTAIPSKDFGGINQIMVWLEKRLRYLDAKYGYMDEDTIAQKLWNPPTLAGGASQTTTFTVATAKTTDVYKCDLSTMLMNGTTVKAECLADGVITVTHSNPTSTAVNLEEMALTVYK